MSIDQLIKIKARNKHGIDLLKYNDLIEILNKCKSEKVDIIAIEAFRLNGEKIQPLMEKSLDFSTRKFTWEELNAYIESIKDSNYMFELIVD